MSDPNILEAWTSQNAEVAIKIWTGGGNRRNYIRTHNEFQAGMSQGETIHELAGRVERVLECDREMAFRVASNVLGAVLSEARWLGHQQGGMTHKKWLCPASEHPLLPGHKEAEERYRTQPIPLDEPFIVNGARLRFPRDYLCGKPDECIDCQCASIATRVGF